MPSDFKRPGSEVKSGSSKNNQSPSAHSGIQKTQTEKLAGKGEKKQSLQETAKSSGKNVKLLSAGDLGPFRSDALDTHNRLRALHKAPALTLADDLTLYAQRWAEHLVTTGRFEHNDGNHSTGPLGENLASAWSSKEGGADLSGEKATMNWYNEIKDHNFKKEFQKGTGHFTQVVWVDTKELGVGKAKGTDGRCVVAAAYRPMGNMKGAYAQNVIP